MRMGPRLQKEDDANQNKLTPSHQQQLLRRWLHHLMQTCPLLAMYPWEPEHGLKRQQSKNQSESNMFPQMKGCHQMENSHLQNMYPLQPDAGMHLHMGKT